MKGFIPATLAFFMCGCGDLPQSAPKMIDADGTTYFACEGMVWVSSESGTFKISFTDQNHLDVVLRGVKKVTVSDLPQTVAVPMPYPLPEPPGFYGDGKPWKEGDEIDWPDGTKARLQNGKLVPIMVPAKYCAKT
jgi:hypothetical protein